MDYLLVSQLQLPQTDNTRLLSNEAEVMVLSDVWNVAEDGCQEAAPFIKDGSVRQKLRYVVISWY